MLQRVADLGLEMLDDVRKPAEKATVQQGYRYRKIEVGQSENAQLATVGTVFDLPAWDETETSTACDKRDLQIMAENFCRNSQRQVGQIEAPLDRIPVAAPWWVEDPFRSCQIPEADMPAEIRLGRRRNDLRRRHHDNLLDADRSGINSRCH